MKVLAILTADWHLRETVPRCRTNQFITQQFKKVDYISELQKKYNIPIFHAGDLFHHWKPSPALLSMVMEHLPSQFFTVYGNHDLPTHSLERINQSGINVLRVAHFLNVPEDVNIGNYGTDKPYTVKLGKENQYTLGIWHRFIYKGQQRENWYAEEAMGASVALQRFSICDIMLTGDNHIPFVDARDGHYLVNSGNITRQTIDTMASKPRVYLLVDNGTHLEVKKHYLPIEAEEECFLPSCMEVQQEENVLLARYVEALKRGSQETVSFESMLEQFFLHNKVKEKVKKVIYFAMEADDK